MYADYGTGRICDGCGDAIEPSQIEYECVYRDGSAHVLHLACAALLDAEQRRRGAVDRPMRMQDSREDAHRLRRDAQQARDDARDATKKSSQLRDHSDVLSREAEVVRAESRNVKRGAVTPLRGLRILLVEDRADDRDMLMRLLMTAGALVLEATTPLDALPLLTMATWSSWISVLPTTAPGGSWDRSMQQRAACP